MPPALKRKVGPLPVWGWIGAVSLGVLIWYVRRQQAGTVTTPTNAQGADVTYPTVGSGAGGAGLPDAVTGGGTYPTAAQELADVTGLAQGFADLYGALPYAGAYSSQDPSTGSSQYDAVSTTASIIKELQDTGLIASASPTAVTTADVAAKPKSHTEAGYHSGHSKGHEYFLPGTGWVSKARYQAATVGIHKTGTSVKAASPSRPVQRSSTPVTHAAKPKKKKRTARRR